MVGECLGGALYVNDFHRICSEVGFAEPRILNVDTISVDDPELVKVAGSVNFYSVTFRRGGDVGACSVPFVPPDARSPPPLDMRSGCSSFRGACWRTKPSRTTGMPLNTR